MSSISITDDRAPERKPYGSLSASMGMGLFRRRPILITAGALLAGPRSFAQLQPKLPRIGFVLTTAALAEMTGAEPRETVMRGFVHGLRTLGYLDGKNIVIERRKAEGRLERLEEIIHGLVRILVLRFCGSRYCAFGNGALPTGSSLFRPRVP